MGIRAICLFAVAASAAACFPPPTREDMYRHAAYTGDLGGVRSFLDAGVDVNSEDSVGSNALAGAARSGHRSVVNLLLDRGADIDAAIGRCEDSLEWGRVNHNSTVRQEATTCLQTLRSLKARRAEARQAEQETARALAVEAERTRQLKEMVREVVSAAAQAPKTAAAAALVSDVDKPAYGLAARSEDFALVVGIGKYSDIPEAQFAERDAEAVKNHLIAAGLPSRNVIQLFGEKAGRSAMEKFLETWLPRNVGENSRVFFYFSGHGAPDPATGEAYLIPWDGDPNFLENTGYPIKRLYAKLAALKAKEVIVALDACFSGAGGRSVLAKGARPLVTKVDRAAVPSKLLVFAAASSEQITSTLEDQGHGTFTYYFLKGFGGEAKDAAGAVTAQGLYDYLKPKVQDAARRQNRDQQPVLHAQGDRELVRFE